MSTKPGQAHSPLSPDVRLKTPIMKETGHSVAVRPFIVGVIVLVTCLGVAYGDAVQSPVGAARKYEISSVLETNKPNNPGNTFQISGATNRITSKDELVAFARSLPVGASVSFRREPRQWTVRLGTNKLELTQLQGLFVSNGVPYTLIESEPQW